MSTLQIIISILGGIVVIVSSVYGSMWFMVTHTFKLGEKWNHKKEFEKEINNKFYGMSVDMEGLKKTAKLHSENITRVNTFLETAFPKYIGIFSGKNSPRSLNERGEQLFKELNGKNFLNENREGFFKAIDALNPLTKFDVETGSLQVLIEHTKSPIFNHIKDIVYEMPEIDVDGMKYAISMRDVCFILSIPLRDMYIKERGF